MTAARPAPNVIDASFALHGTMQPLLKATASGYKPARPFGGWLAVWGLLGADGQVTPQVDRQGHFFEAAQELGRIDFSEYLGKARIWDDTHMWDNPDFPDVGKIGVGVPTALEYHGPTSPLAKAHGKVGWWTEGHLFDRDDPKSWRLFTTYEPTARDLARADYFHDLSRLLKGTPRDLGISAEGKMLLSPCGKRIIWAKVQRAAVCEIPQAPASTLQRLELAVPIRRGMVGASPCDSCRCPPGACRTLRLNQSSVANIVDFDPDPDPPMPADLLEEPDDEESGEAEEEELSAKLARLVGLLQRRHGLSKKDAVHWIRGWQARDTPRTSTIGEGP